MCEMGLVKGGKFYIIEESSHHVYMDHPNIFVYKIVNDVFGEDIGNEYLETVLEKEETE